MKKRKVKKGQKGEKRRNVLACLQKRSLNYRMNVDARCGPYRIDVETMVCER